MKLVWFDIFKTRPKYGKNHNVEIWVWTYAPESTILGGKDLFCLKTSRDFSLPNYFHMMVEPHMTHFFQLWIKSNPVRMKHRISLVDRITEPDDVTMNVNKVPNTFKILLERKWLINLRIIQLQCWKKLYKFSERVSCWDFTEYFSVSAEAGLLEHLPWTQCISFTSSKPTRYLENNP